MASVEIKGLDDLKSHLKQISNVNLVDAITKATVVTHAQAKILAPVDKGVLKGSIHMEVKKDKDVIGRVYTNLIYAPFVEFGTGKRGTGSYRYENELSFGLKYKSDWAGMKAQPYMFPAMKLGKKVAKEQVKTTISSVIRKK